MTLTIHDDLVQQSPEWYDARRGLVTASIVKHLITVAPPDALAVACPNCEVSAREECINKARRERTTIKSPHAERAAAANHLPPTYVPTMSDSIINFLAAERASGHVEETWPSRDMERGIESETYARELYSKHYGKATEVGFMVREFDGFKIGYSPDGLVGDEGLIEIKAPRQKAHFATVVAGEVPSEHMAQLQTGLLVSGREWIDYLPYHGGLPLWRKRVTPDQRWQAAIVAAAEQAEKAITAAVAKYEQATKGLPATKRIDFNVVELRGIA